MEQVKTITLGAQGWYETPEALAKAVPIGENGWWAVVGSTDTIWVWDSDSSAWKDTFTATELGDYYTREQIDSKLNGKANSSHTHDDRYYTESEVDTKLNGKANSSHTHTKSQITDFPTLGTAAAKNVGDFAAASHTHNYAGSSSAGGSATSAAKLDTATAGSATQPVYFTGGKPVACTYTLGKSVPSNAVFTDTNTWRGIQNNLTSTTDSLSAAQGKVLNEKIAAAGNGVTASGSNYVRFGDGTQICWGSMSYNNGGSSGVTATVTYTFPAAFKDTTYMLSIFNRTGSDTTKPTKTSTGLTFKTAYTNTNTFEFVAIGRWK